jgi:hypothetical protein
MIVGEIPITLARAAEQMRFLWLENARVVVCSRCKLSDIGTHAGARRFLVTLKPNHFRNRADLSRFLVRFNVLSARLEAGRLSMKMILETAGLAPLLRHSSGEYHDGGAGKSI